MRKLKTLNKTSNYKILSALPIMGICLASTPQTSSAMFRSAFNSASRIIQNSTSKTLSPATSKVTYIYRNGSRVAITHSNSLKNSNSNQTSDISATTSASSSRNTLRTSSAITKTPTPIPSPSSNLSVRPKTFTSSSSQGQSTNNETSNKNNNTTSSTSTLTTASTSTPSSSSNLNVRPKTSASSNLQTQSPDSDDDPSKMNPFSQLVLQLISNGASEEEITDTIANITFPILKVNLIRNYYERTLLGKVNPKIINNDNNSDLAHLLSNSILSQMQIKVMEKNPFFALKLTK